MNMKNILNISDQDILSRFWRIKFTMGIAAILIAFGLPSWFEKYVDLPIELASFLKLPYSLNEQQI